MLDFWRGISNDEEKKLLAFQDPFEWRFILHIDLPNAHCKMASNNGSGKDVKPYGWCMDISYPSRGWKIEHARKDPLNKYIQS